MCSALKTPVFTATTLVIQGIDARENLAPRREPTVPKFSPSAPV
jgi:hypothetical protein